MNSFYIEIIIFQSDLAYTTYLSMLFKIKETKLLTSILFNLKPR